MSVALSGALEPARDATPLDRTASRGLSATQRLPQQPRARDRTRGRELTNATIRGGASLGAAQSSIPPDHPDMIDPTADPLDTDVEYADRFLGWDDEDAE